MSRPVLQVTIDDSLPAIFDALMPSDCATVPTMSTRAPHVSTPTPTSVRADHNIADATTSRQQGILIDARYVNTTVQRCCNVVQQSVLVRAWRPLPSASSAGTGAGISSASSSSTRTNATYISPADHHDHCHRPQQQQQQRQQRVLRVCGERTTLECSNEGGATDIVDCTPPLHVCVCEVYLIIYTRDVQTLMKRIPVTRYLRQRCPRENSHHPQQPSALDDSRHRSEHASADERALHTRKTGKRRRRSGDGSREDLTTRDQPSHFPCGDDGSGDRDAHAECTALAQQLEHACGDDEVSVLHCYLDAVSSALNQQQQQEQQLQRHDPFNTRHTRSASHSTVPVPCTLHVIVVPDNTGRGRPGPATMAEFYAELLSWSPTLTTSSTRWERCADTERASAAESSARAMPVRLGVCALAESVVEAMERVRSGVQAVARHHLIHHRSAQTHRVAATRLPGDPLRGAHAALSSGRVTRVAEKMSNRYKHDHDASKDGERSGSEEEEEDVHDLLHDNMVHRMSVGDDNDGDGVHDRAWDGSAAPMLVSEDLRPRQPRKCDPVDFLQLYRNMLCEISFLSERKTLAVVNAFPTMNALLSYMDRQQQEQQAVRQATGKHVDLGSVYSRSFGEQRASNVLSDEIVDALTTCYFGEHAHKQHDKTAYP